LTIHRSKAPAHYSRELAKQLNALYGPCIECKDCHGLCPSLIEALTLPDAVLKKKAEPE